VILIGSIRIANRNALDWTRLTVGIWKADSRKMRILFLYLKTDIMHFTGWLQTTVPCSN